MTGLGGRGGDGAQSMPQELPYFAANGHTDMFWAQSYDAARVRAHCQEAHGVTPKPAWVALEFGGRAALAATSNIIFSQGEYDPWLVGGVTADALAAAGAPPSVVVLPIAQGAHHLDLMWAHPGDPESVVDARAAEMDTVVGWLAEHRARHAVTAAAAHTGGDSAAVASS